MDLAGLVALPLVFLAMAVGGLLLEYAKGERPE